MLEIGELSKQSYGNLQKEIFSWDFNQTHFTRIKILIFWIDVLWAEKLVLEGAKNTLKKVRAIFIEISIENDFYLSSQMEILNDILLKNDFKLILGTDYNLTGNALYIK